MKTFIFKETITLGTVLSGILYTVYVCNVVFSKENIKYYPVILL